MTTKEKAAKRYITLAEIGGKICRPLSVTPDMYTRAIVEAMAFGTWAELSATVYITKDEDGALFWEVVQS